ncbi:MAG: FAD-binding and (Fe-S)-binding domain-containing protein [Chloroflexota bacterium]
MGKLNKKPESYLVKEFGDRVTFSRTERRLYGHDIAAIPGIIKTFIGDTTPEAVVQPTNEDELMKLVRWAAENNIPLTPRGKATSGYGGVLPVKKGVVVDFYRMNRIIGRDSQNQTVTVQAGVVWEKLDKELAKHKLTLRLYPTSYPSSTVGGWLAQGGTGIGSYEMGWFRDNVIGARAVLPDGTIKEFSGAGLDLLSDAEGITGLISEVTLRIQPLEEIEVRAISCPDANNLQKFFQSLVDSKLPIWSLIFINPRMAEFKNVVPLMEHRGHAVEERVLLPKAYIVTLAFRKKDSRAVMEKLPEIMKSCNCEILSEDIAHHEWENRFKIMTVKRLGPSLVPAEFTVPLTNLAGALTEIGQKVEQPVIKEGIVIRPGADRQTEVTILGFIPSDQRRFSYNFVFSLALTIFKIAEKYGGRPYATGLYFKGQANKILGKERVKSLQEFKAREDPKNIMNPGKVLGGGLLDTILNMANTFEPVLRPLGNKVALNIGERPDKPVRGIPADVAWYAYGCSQCGYCVDECDQFYGRGWESQSPRGKWYWLREYMEGREEWDQFMVDTIIACTTCELCNLRCSASLPIEQSWLKLRGQLVGEQKKMTFPPFEIMAAALGKEGDIWAGYRKDRSKWFPKELNEKHGTSHQSKTVYFTGCTASYVEHDIAMASVRLLDAAGVDFGFLGKKENCCGTPMLVAGKWDDFKAVMQKNIQAVKEAGADTVITSCPACDMMWRQIYPQWAKKLGIEFGITTKHYSEVVSEKIRNGEFAFKKDGHKPCTVTWHDSCHIGRASHVYEPPRELIKALPEVKLVEMDHNRDTAHCCGSVLTLIKDPPVAAEVGKVRLEEAQETGAQKVLALCPCCEFQLRVSAGKKQIPLEVVDLARFAASYLGYEFPDPNPEVQRQWAVFEAMTALMTPEGFAKLMGTMWPELIDAMPFRMGPMMRLMGKIPSALNLMKPMFPILFPRLLPMMMPKVMPVMVERVAGFVPMPDYMSEQMPELMPKVMDNLMPQMIGDVVPLVVEPMINYLTGKKK